MSKPRTTHAFALSLGTMIDYTRALALLLAEAASAPVWPFSVRIFSKSFFMAHFQNSPFHAYIN